MRRTMGQCTAFLIVRLQSPEVANQAIRDGLIIMGKQFKAIKMKKEPRRCLNCQQLGTTHLAAACNKPTICGTCGKEHCTTEFTKGDQERHWCINCKTHGYASWDPMCLKFIEVSQRL